MEGADTWYEDQTTAVHQMFKIQGISDGGNDISTINGQINSFTEEMAFPYSGDNSYIDRINAVAPASLFSKINIRFIPVLLHITKVLTKRLALHLNLVVW
jgi:hypothetical protein